jgi:SHS2 domain-containing protein
VRSHLYLPDVAIADLAFDASGSSPQEMFEAAAQALTEAMVDIKQVQPKIEKTIVLGHAAMDQLLFDWLAELIYLKDAEYLLFSQFHVELTSNQTWQLTGKIRGERIDPNRHALHMDVKAVTYHLFQIAQKDGQWIARVVVDV